MNIEEKGYIVFRGAIDCPYDLIKENLVEYTEMTRYINDTMMRFINKQLNWNAQWTKYRVSDNNNSADASVFHRDIIPQSDPVKKDVFTCLVYLDKTIMEVIPGSHLKNGFSFKREQLILYPGDVLLFYSTLLHRGIFTEGLSHRRLIQVFEVCPNIEEYNYYIDRSYHVPADETYSDFMITISKTPILNFVPNFLSYINASVGYGVLFDELEFLSSEGLRGRVSGTGWQEINKYVVKPEIHDLPEKYRSRFKFRCYYRQYLVTIILLILLVYINGQFLTKMAAKLKTTKR